MEGFFRTERYDALVGEAFFPGSLSFSKWGVPDHLLFNEFSKMIDTLPRPFQTTILTLSNHEPYDLPDSSFQLYAADDELAKQLNVLHYADYALGSLIDSLKQKPVFDSTIFVFVSDHARMFPTKVINDPSRFHIPLLIYAPGLIGDTAQRIDTYGSQVDFLPTFMSLLSRPYIHHSWGRDLLALTDTERGFAVLDQFTRISWLDKKFLYSEQLGTGKHWYENRNPQFPEIIAPPLIPVDLLQRQTALYRYCQLAEQLSLPISSRP